MKLIETHSTDSVLKLLHSNTKNTAHKHEKKLHTNTKNSLLPTNTKLLHTNKAEICAISAILLTFRWSHNDHKQRHWHWLRSLTLVKKMSTQIKNRLTLRLFTVSLLFPSCHERVAVSGKRYPGKRNDLPAERRWTTKLQIRAREKFLAVSEVRMTIILTSSRL